MRPELEVHCEKVPVHFMAPSWDVTDQNLSRREYVSLMKPEVFPDIHFPSPEFSQNPFESVSVPVRSFPGYSSSSAVNSSKIFDNSFVYLFPARNFPGFPLGSMVQNMSRSGLDFRQCSLHHGCENPPISVAFF